MSIEDGDLSSQTWICDSQAGKKVRLEFVGRLWTSSEEVLVPEIGSASVGLGPSFQTEMDSAYGLAYPHSYPQWRKTVDAADLSVDGIVKQERLNAYPAYA